MMILMNNNKGNYQDLIYTHVIISCIIFFVFLSSLSSLSLSPCFQFKSTLFPFSFQHSRFANLPLPVLGWAGSATLSARTKREPILVAQAVAGVAFLVGVLFCVHEKGEMFKVVKCIQM